MPISELTPFHVGLILDHFLNDCEIRYWFVPSKEHDSVPAYINLANYYTANNELIAMGIIENVSHLDEAKGPIEATYRDVGRQAYATRITEIGKKMFNQEQMVTRTIN